MIYNPDLPMHKRCYEEAFAPLPDGAIKQASDDLLQAGGRRRRDPHRSIGRDVTLLLDFGRIVTGRPWIEVEARGGEEIEIACCESLPGEWRPEGPADRRPADPNPWLGADSHLCRYRAKAGVQRFERFEWCAIRWMQVTVRNAPEGLIVRGLGANLTNYPVEARGQFASSEPFLDQLWATRSTIPCANACTTPGRTAPAASSGNRLGDVTVENLVGWAAFGPSVAPLTAKYLAQVAESQRPDGLTQMFAPGDHRTNGTLIPDWTLQWILTAADHYRYTGDLPRRSTGFSPRS